MPRQSFLKGSFILMVAGFVTRVLGMINGMVLARVIGDEGVGLYMMAYPAMLLVVTLTEIGLPVAISKLVAEADSFGDRGKIRLILALSLSIVSIISVVLTLLTLLAVPMIVSRFYVDKRVLYPLLAVIPVIPIVAVASVIRGYFQGVRNMKPYAYSGIIEQLVRISLVFILANTLMPRGVAFAAAGAMIAGAAGECASLLYMLRCFHREGALNVRRMRFKQLRTSASVLFQLLNIGLPTMGSRLIGSLSNFLEPMIVSNGLMIAGYSLKSSAQLYGELTGYAMTLLLLPTFITHALHVALVPAVSEAHARRNYGMIHYRLNQALRIAMLCGGLSILVTTCFAKPLMAIIYNSPESAHFLYLMAPFFIIFYFQAPMHAVLQALNLARPAMYNTLIGAIVKTIALFVLTSQPAFGINGVALAICLNVVLVSLLHAGVMFKAIGFSLVVRDFVKAGIVFALSGLLAQLLLRHAFLELSIIPRTFVLMTLLSAAYGLLALIAGLISREQLHLLPVIGRFFEVKRL
ncbi:MAG: stage V sporulation protein B [Sporolactobacillus sp.]